ncbi:MAG: FAD-binding protein [Clostridiales bacterium]|nr:FAD-binding protein [Clostridiales bacterium]
MKNTKNKLSRRDFIRSAGAGAATLAASGLFGGIAHAEESAVAASGEAIYTPGTYTASATGMGTVTVTITFDETSITDVVVDVSNETENIGQLYGETLQEALLAAQSADIDGVSGATLTSDAVKEAAANCIAQAMGVAVESADEADTDSSDPYIGTDEEGNTVYYSMRRSWVGEAPTFSESEIAGEYSADVIIIGANYSGANCFRMACEQGATCIVLDSQSEDSFEAYGGQLGHFNSQWQEDVLGVPKDYFDPVDFIESYQLQSAGRAQPDLISKWAKRNGELVDWMTELYDDIAEITGEDTIEPDSDYSYKKGFFMTYPAVINLGSGSMSSSGEFCTKTVQAGLEASPDSQAFYNMTAKVLIKDGDTVCGVIAQSLEDDQYYRFMAKKGVVLATGDFSANSDMYRSLCTEVQECNPYTELTGSGRDGYGHRMGIWAGGVMEIGPRAAMGGATSALPMGFFGAASGLWINKYGKRYCNEAFGVPFVAGCQSARQPIDSSIIQVWDEGHWREFAQNQALGHFNASDISDAKMDEYAATLEEVKAAGAEGLNNVYCADTLEELASYLGFEGEYAENFVNAVETYDAYAEAGKDEDYAKPADMMFRISDGPFYAEKLDRNANIVLVTLSGLFVDGNQQVLNQKFEPIPGLFATGNASGGRFPLQYTAPMNGISIGFATVFGALLGEYLGQSAPEVSTGDSATSATGTVD